MLLNEIQPLVIVIVAAAGMIDRCVERQRAVTDFVLVGIEVIVLYKIRVSDLVRDGSLVIDVEPAGVIMILVAGLGRAVAARVIPLLLLPELIFGLLLGQINARGTAIVIVEIPCATPFFVVRGHPVRERC